MLQSGEQFIDARRVLMASVTDEVQLRDDPRGQFLRNQSPEKSRSAHQPGDRGILRHIVTMGNDPDGSVRQVARHVDCADRHHCHARITDFPTQQRLRQHRTDGFGQLFRPPRCALVPHGSALRRRRGQGASDLFKPVGLDLVTNLEVVEVLDSNTALLPFLHFLRVVLKALER